MAEWQSGYAADCNSVNIGSIPFSASKLMKILVTGSSGFIGYHLTNKLLDLGYHVIGIDNHNDYYDVKLKEKRCEILLKKGLKFFHQDINQIKIKEKGIDIAINLAAQAGVRIEKRKNYLYEHSNINGYKNFCDFCLDQEVPKIIYASSSSVYSDNQGKKFTEGVTNLSPKSSYGISKLSNEEHSSHLLNSSDMEFIGLRFFSVYGPYGRPDMAYFLFTEALKKNLKIILNNEGKMERDMTYIDDIIDGIIRSVDLISGGLRGERHEIINLGNDMPITTLKLLRTLENKLMKYSKIQLKKTTTESKYTHADISKAKRLLGYKPKVCFEEGISKFLEWHEKYERY